MSPFNVSVRVGAYRTTVTEYAESFDEARELAVKTLVDREQCSPEEVEIVSVTEMCRIGHRLYAAD